MSTTMTGIPTDATPIDEEEVKTEDEQAEETEDNTEESEPAESSTEKQEQSEDVEETASSDAEENADANIPLNKDKRFQEIVNEKNELKAQLEELNEWRREMETKTVSKESDQKPEWFTRLYGDNEEVWSVMKAQFGEVEKRAVEKAIAQIESKREQEARQYEEAQNYVKSQLQELKSEGKTFDQNAVIKTALDMKLFDDSGNYNLRAAYEVWNAKQTKAPNTAKKRIASDTVKGAKATGTKEPVSISQIRQAGGFRGLNKLMQE